ncbi:MAG TPA: citramalate synthase [Polyangiaceae bacterium]|jgi:2-isopropylmalate synthase
MKPPTEGPTPRELLPTIQIYDTTLRDGTQREGVCLSAADKLRIARRLDALGVAFIELGWPGSNPKDTEVFARARDVDWSVARIAAFGATRRAGLGPEDDPQVSALLATGAPVCTLFGKTSITHVRQVLRVAPEENLRMIGETVRYLVENGRQVVYDAEHFFDGYGEDAEYAMETLRAASAGGAEVLALCDTNGGTLPWVIEERVRAVRSAVSGAVGIHAHDDVGCGVANTLAAVRGGASHVQGTINGYGERCGNGNLCSIVPTLELKMRRRCLAPGALAHLTQLARQVAEIANLAADSHAPYVGHSAFAHKGGVHVAAIRRFPRAYEHIDPAQVGNETRVVMSELSGRGNVLAKAEEHEVTLDAGGEAEVLEDVKTREARGFAFEAAEGSVSLLLRRRAPGYVPPFELLDYRVTVGQRREEGASADAAIKIRVGSQVVHTAAEGNGPVSALDAALRKALGVAYPEVEGIRLEDYKVRILDGVAGTAATVRVTIDSARGESRWTTMGASSNVLEASWTALADGIEYGLLVARETEGAGTSVKGAA